MAIKDKWSTRKKDLRKAAEDIYEKHSDEIDRGIILEASQKAGKFSSDFDSKEAFIDKFMKKAEVMMDKAAERGARTPSASKIAQAVQRTRTFTSYEDLSRENFIETASKLDPQVWREVKSKLHVRSKADLFTREYQGQRAFSFDKSSGKFKFVDETGKVWFIEIENYKKKNKEGLVTNQKTLTAKLL